MLQRVIRFEESYWMKPHIMLNTRLRTASKNKLQIDFFKLMNSSVFGKTMENISNQKDKKLVKNLEKYGKCVMMPNFKCGYPFWIPE